MHKQNFKKKLYCKIIDMGQIGRQSWDKSALQGNSIEGTLKRIYYKKNLRKSLFSLFSIYYIKPMNM